MHDSGKAAAVAAVNQWLTHHGHDAAWLQSATGITRVNIAAFLSGRAWPHTSTRHKIEAALGWEFDTLANLANGTHTPAPVSALPHRNLQALLGQWCAYRDHLDQIAGLWAQTRGISVVEAGQQLERLRAQRLAGTTHTTPLPGWGDHQ